MGLAQEYTHRKCNAKKVWNQNQLTYKKANTIGQWKHWWFK